MNSVYGRMHLGVNQLPIYSDMNQYMIRVYVYCN